MHLLNLPLLHYLEQRQLKRLFLLPQNGTLELKYEENEWKPIYSDNLNSAQMNRVHEAIKKVMDIEKAPQSFEPLIDDKGGEITYSPTGINAPWEIKEAYDPDHSKRQKIRDALVKLLPEFEIGIGGSTSIDITKPGMNKLFGVKKLLELDKLTPDRAIYIGDALFPGGNDAAVIPSGVTCISVKGPEDTEKVIDEILKTG